MLQLIEEDREDPAKGPVTSEHMAERIEEEDLRFPDGSLYTLKRVRQVLSEVFSRSPGHSRLKNPQSMIIGNGLQRGMQYGFRLLREDYLKEIGFFDRPLK